MARRGASTFSRQLLIASIVFGVFIVFDILLFGWLIFRSLSQREIDRVLLATKADARGLAERIASGADESPGMEGDLYVVMAREKEIQRYIDDELAQREEVQQVTIFDKDGTVVYRASSTRRPTGGEPLSSPLVIEPSSPEMPQAGPLGDGAPGPGEPGYEVTEAIGELGSIRIGLSRSKVQERGALLRRELLKQMISIVIVSLAVLLSAYAIIVILLRRARRLEEQAREADSMAYIGTLAAGLAHEIRNPLNSLNLNMQMLEEELSGGRGPRDTATSGRLLSITRQEISRLERLATDFLLYAKPRSPELEELAPLALLTRVEQVLRHEVETRGARLKTEDSSGGALVRVDPAQITQLLLNLAQNALAATEEKEGVRAQIVLAARLSGDRLALLVEDNGVGIPPEEQARIFGLFYSTRKGGTGLGLAVVERIARAHGGTIELKSEPGAGTSIGISLPVSSFSKEPAFGGRPGRDTVAASV